MSDYAYSRVLLKLSGEALLGEREYGIDVKMLETLAKEIKPAWEGGVQIAIVVGGGNIFRGLAGASRGMDRAQADYMGMLATVMNSLALQDCFERNGIESRVMSAIEMREVSEPYIRRRAERHLEKGRITIFGAGTGNPYFTTDTAAALRACEIGANCLMKATKVNGVYDKDPNVYADAHKFDTVSYQKVITDKLRVMDATAIALCQDNHMPLVVFNITEPGVFCRALKGEPVGTTIVEED